jgi:hypothetical protein
MPHYKYLFRAFERDPGILNLPVLKPLSAPSVT